MSTERPTEYEIGKIERDAHIRGYKEGRALKVTDKMIWFISKALEKAVKKESVVVNGQDCCPICKDTVKAYYNYCPMCGQFLGRRSDKEAKDYKWQ